MYIWKVKGIHNADANMVGEEIGSLENITPHNVVDKAREKTSSMHGLFEWNDGVAGEKFREIQAGKIIRNLVFEQPKDEGKPQEKKEIRVFYSTGERNNTYKPATVIFNDADEYARLLERAREELIAFKRKYSCLKELQAILDLIP